MTMVRRNRMQLSLLHETCVVKLFRTETLVMPHSQRGTLSSAFIQKDRERRAPR